MNTFREHWAVVQAGLERAAQRSGRRLEDVSLVAVSKGHPVEAIQEAVAAGQLLFGESKVQEAQAKVAAAPGATWHFIGHLQKNKVRPALPLFAMVQSVDSLELGRAIDRISGELERATRVLLEVNIAGEESKHGFAPATLREQMEGIMQLGHVQVEGLMTIPPYVEEAESSRRYFVQLRELKVELEERFAVHLPTLSMGMSHDYEVAVEEGATLVRVGTALFGAR